jgi:hypothetical protein
VKGRLGCSPLTGKVYIGSHNGKEWGGRKTDITSEFIQVVLQKFPPGFTYTIAVDGVVKYGLTVTEIEETGK